MQTPATVLLDREGIGYGVHRYDHDPAAPSFGMEAAEVLGLDPDVVFKTLMAQLDGDGFGDRGELVVAIVPVAEMLDLKALARAERAKMADVTDAERATGYIAGGISPFGQKKRHRTFIDETAEICDRVYVSGGQRGLDISLTPADLVTVLDAVVAPLATAR